MGAPVLNGRAVIAAERGAVLEILGGGRTVEAVEEIVRVAHDRAEWLVGEAKRVDPPGPIACREGCDFCCHLRVRTTIPEILSIVGHLRSNLDDGELAIVRERVEASERETAALSPQARLLLRAPCPLLEDGRCSVYEVRPSSCRGWNSLDVAGCEADFGHPERNVSVPVYLTQHQTYAFIQEGMVAGIAAAGLESITVDLVAALHIAFNCLDATDRWLAGETLFGDAKN